MNDATGGRSAEKHSQLSVPLVVVVPRLAERDAVAIGLGREPTRERRDDAVVRRRASGHEHVHSERRIGASRGAAWISPRTAAAVR